ncbi:hypothetical protein FQZ97_1119780 [compost metagenome]
MADSQAQKELQRAVEHADFFDQWHWAVELGPAHAEVEAQRVVGALSSDTGAPVEHGVAFFLKNPVTLGLTSDVLHRFVGQGGGIAESEGVVDSQQPVDPVPACAIAGQAEVFRVVASIGFHD